MFTEKHKYYPYIFKQWASVYVCVCVCLYVYRHTYIYVYIDTHTFHFVYIYIVYIYTQIAFHLGFKLTSKILHIYNTKHMPCIFLVL